MKTPEKKSALPIKKKDSSRRSCVVEPGTRTKLTCSTIAFLCITTKTVGGDRTRNRHGSFWNDASSARAHPIPRRSDVRSLISRQCDVVGRIAPVNRWLKLVHSWLGYSIRDQLRPRSDSCGRRRARASDKCRPLDYIRDANREGCPSSSRAV